MEPISQNLPRNDSKSESVDEKHTSDTCKVSIVPHTGDKIEVHWPLDDMFYPGPVPI